MFATWMFSDSAPSEPYVYNLKTDFKLLARLESKGSLTARRFFRAFGSINIQRLAARASVNFSLYSA